MKRFLLLFAALTLCAGSFAQTQKVTLRAPGDVKVEVFRGFADTIPLRPVSAKMAMFGGGKSYQYALEPGRYHFVASGNGYYTLHKDFVVPESKNINANPGKMGGKGYEPKRVYEFTDKTSASLALGALAKKFPKVMTVPGLNPKKPAQEHATQEEMEAFLVKLDDPKDNMYRYIVGKTTLGLAMPLAVFTTDDITGKDLPEAADIMRRSGKPTVYLHAHIHGNEPSAGDGALAMIAELDGKYGQKVLPYVNVLVLPRVNGDGAKAWTRGTSVAPDMNRDNLLAANPEIKAAHHIYNLFLPEVVMDMHEYGASRNVMRDKAFLDDAGITVSGNQNNTRDLNELMKKMMRYVESTGAKEGLRYWEYTQGGYSDQAPLHASHYYALRGSLNFLVETPNASLDKGTTFARRVMTQFFAAKALIEFTISNSGVVRSTVEADRAATVRKGLLGTDPIVLKHGQNKEAYEYNRKYYDMADGKLIKDSTFAVRYYEVPEITRERPRAYVIPKNVPQIGRILEIMEYNGITWSELPAGSRIPVRGYMPGDKDAKPRLCVIGVEEEVEFPAGAYLFTMAQPSGLVLAMLMEPDFVKTDKFPISLVQAKLLETSQVYRCEKPL